MRALQEIKIRKASEEDVPSIRSLFKDTIAAICLGDYNQQQIDAWVSAGDNIQKWISKLASQYFLVAENKGEIVGFASLEDCTYIDYLYVHKGFQREGIGVKLLLALEKEALRNKATIIKADVSKTALTFFRKNKFDLVSENLIKVEEIEMNNYTMIKSLSFN